MEAFVADLVLEGGDRFLDRVIAARTQNRSPPVTRRTCHENRWLPMGRSDCLGETNHVKERDTAEDYVVGFLCRMVGAERSAGMHNKTLVVQRRKLTCWACCAGPVFSSAI